LYKKIWESNQVDNWCNFPNRSVADFLDSLTTIQGTKSPEIFLKSFFVASFRWLLQYM